MTIQGRGLPLPYPPPAPRLANPLAVWPASYLPGGPKTLETSLIFRILAPSCLILSLILHILSYLMPILAQLSSSSANLNPTCGHLGLLWSLLWAPGPSFGASLEPLDPSKTLIFHRFLKVFHIKPSCL